MLGNLVGHLTVVQCGNRIEGCRESIGTLRRIELEEEAVARRIEQAMGRRRTCGDLLQGLLDIACHRAFQFRRCPRTRGLLEDPHPVGEPFEVGEQYGAAGNMQPVGHG